MSSVWSASMSNGGGDLACHMCLSAYELTGRDVETNWINTRRHWGGALHFSDVQFTKQQM